MKTDLISSWGSLSGADSRTTSIPVRWPLRTVACLVSSDSAAMLVSLLSASVLRNLIVDKPAGPIYGTIIPALVTLICTFTIAGLYRCVSLNAVEEVRLCTLSVVLAYLSLWAGNFFAHDFSESRFLYILSCVFSVVVVPFFRSLVRHTLSRAKWWGHSVAILGLGTTGKLVLQTLASRPGIGLRPIAVLDDNSEQYRTLSNELMRGPLSKCLEITRIHKISYGIICMPSLCRADLLQLLDRYGQCFGHILVIPNLIGMTSLGICAREVGGIVGLEVTQQLLRPSSRFIKRGLDLLVTLILGPLILPIIAILALLIVAEDSGPVFYANDRIGFRGRTFKAWKLRSMITNGEEVLREYLETHPAEQTAWLTTQKLKNDPRLTRVGKLIRKTSLDELPQLWNVLLGEMSLVGPRPILETQVELYGPNFELYKQVRPGITGLWQVSGRNNLNFAERVSLDKYVIQNWSVWMDVYILARTAEVVLRASGAY